jgi:hypothetical protein
VFRSGSPRSSGPVRSRTRAQGTPLSEGLSPNDLWCTDYKGEFMLADKCARAHVLA